MIGPYELDSVVVGDSRELAVNIPNNSIDMIVTDPLYHEEHMHYYGWLAQTATRILKPGAWAFVYGGWVAKEVLELLYHDSWDYFMTIALVNRGGYPRWWSKKLMIGWKPVYVFTKGKPEIMKWQSNIADADAMDKRYHRFGQGVGFAIEKIDMFTQPDDIIFDPFCGGGQIPAACIATGRHYLSFEIDSKTADEARARLMKEQRPIVVPEPQQSGWDIGKESV